MSQLDLGIDSIVHTHKMHYLFLLSPGSAISEQVIQARNYIRETMEISFKRGFMPHLSVLDFEKVENDQKIIDIAHHLLDNQKRITLGVQEVSRFDHKVSETLAITFKNPIPVFDIHYQLSLANDTKPKTNFIPHITIAKQIPKTTYNLGLALSSFIKETIVECDKLVILKKPMVKGGEKLRYDKICEIELQG